MSEWIALSHEEPTEDDAPIALAQIVEGEITMVDASFIASSWRDAAFTHWARLPGVPRSA